MVARHRLRTYGSFGETSACQGLRFSIVQGMKKFLLVMLCTLSVDLALSSTLFSEWTDTTRQYVAKEVVITGNRMPVPVERLPSSVQVVDSVSMAQSNGFSVADVVSASAGVFLQNYGGNGALHSISIRGMGSDYSLILLNGQRFTTYEMNTVDLGIFSLMDVDRIEIASGGNSSSYGSDAIGGVVNIITKKPSGKLDAAVSGSVGSFGMSGYQISVGAGDEQLSLRGSMGMENARNDFGFYFDDGSTNRMLEREGADYSLKHYSLSSSAMLNPAAVFTTSIRYSDADRGQPSAVTSPVQNNLARIDDKDLFAAASIELQPSSGIQYSLPVSFHDSHETYADPNLLIGNSPTTDFYHNRVVSSSPTGTYAVSDADKVLAGADAAFAFISSDELKNSSRTQLSGFLSSEDRLPDPLDVIVYPSLRYDSFSDVKGDVSPKIGVNIGLLDEPMLRIRSSYGKSFNAPTFNDLYWTQGGNPNLQPEHSLSFDAGFLYRMELIGNIEAEANYFSVQATDKIVWQPGPNGIWSPVNLQSVSSTGAECTIRAQLWNNLISIRYTGNYVRTLKTSADFPGDATQNKYLPYLPQETSTVVVGANVRNVSAAVTYSYIGFRYVSADNDPRFVLPSFGTVGANLSYRIGLGKAVWMLKGEVNNAFNEDYQFISGYPVPLRNFMVTSELSL